MANRASRVNHQKGNWWAAWEFQTVTTHASADCISSSSDFTLSSAAGRRFVQLPSDVKRSSAVDYQAACSTGVRLPISRPAAAAELLGAVAALLHRYAAQDIIVFDLFDGLSSQPAAFEIAVAGDNAFDAVVERTAPMPTSAAQLSLPANIAVTLLMEPGAELVVTGPYDVHFILERSADAVQLRLGYNAALFKPAAINQLVESFGMLLAAALESPSASVLDLPLLSPQVTYALSVLQDGGSAAYPALPVQTLFSALARSQPDAAAASFHDRTLTYRALDERSNQLAHYLIASGVGPESAVAVCLHPGLDVLVSMLAIWKARAVYLPLDPTHPEALIGRMLQEAKPRLVLTSTGLAGLTADWPQLYLHRDAHLFRDQPLTAPALEASLDDQAYLLYTSGTTGRAKGVMATQRNLVQYVQSAAQKYGFTARDRFVSLARYTFSISLWELLSPLCCGGHLRLLDRKDVLSPERLARCLRDVTVLHAGPSLLGGLFRHLGTLPRDRRSFPQMRHASSGGDIVTPAIMEDMKDFFPHAELFVIYGCSEVSCMGTTYPIERDLRQSRTYVGKPFPNVTLKLLDAQRNPVPFGVVGEICFAGDGIVTGYLDRPELNQEKFVELDGKRFYCTGDMGRLHSDGQLEFLGRRDFQIQLHGIRIELAGIETVAQQLGLAAQCAVVARPHDEGGVQMVAFVVKPRNERIATFRRALAKELPDYMLPHQVVVLDTMPLTVNGKLDRTRLMEMELSRPHGSASQGGAPMTERERKIAAIVAHTLGMRDIGPEDDFFDMGGDSLLGMIALMEIEKQLGISPPPSLLFENGTVRSLARYDGEDLTEVGDGLPRAVSLNGAPLDRTPLFMLSGVHIYRKLAKKLEGVCPAYGIFTQREIDAFVPEADYQPVSGLAEDYIRIMRAHQPHGPYRILGYSFSGIVAYEVAQRLREAGETVEFLALIDSHLPEWNAGWRHRLTMLSRLPEKPWRQSSSFLWQKLRHTFRRSGDQAMVYHDDRELGAWEVLRGMTNYNTIAAYRPHIRPSEGNMLLLVSDVRLRENPLHSPCCGWEPYVTRLDVRHLEADHFQMMREEPHLSRVAAILTESLKQGANPACRV
jgi:amino acid adenylation domain-containing protein